MHGRGFGPSAPASDAAMWEGRRRPRVCATSCHMDFPTRADAAQIGANSRRFGSDARRFASNQTDSRRFGPNRIVSAEYRRVSAGKRKSIGKEKKNLLDWTGSLLLRVLLSCSLFSFSFFEVFCNFCFSFFSKYKNSFFVFCASLTKRESHIFLSFLFFSFLMGSYM